MWVNFSFLANVMIMSSIGSNIRLQLFIIILKEVTYRSRIYIRDNFQREKSSWRRGVGFSWWVYFPWRIFWRNFSQWEIIRDSRSWMCETSIIVWEKESSKEGNLSSKGGNCLGMTYLPTVNVRNFQNILINFPRD